MRITAIEFAGTPKKGQGLARAFARVSRTPSGEWVEINIIKPGGADEKMLLPHDAEGDEVWEAAHKLITVLEGGGTNSETHTYRTELDRLLD